MLLAEREKERERNGLSLSKGVFSFAKVEEISCIFAEREREFVAF